MKVRVLNNSLHSQHVNHFITNSCRRSSDPLQRVDAGVPLKGVLTHPPSTRAIEQVDSSATAAVHTPTALPPAGRLSFRPVGRVT